MRHQTSGLRQLLIFNRYIIFENGEIICQRRGIPLKRHVNNNQLSVNLKINGTNTRKSVAKLLAEAFIPNPYNLRFVKHKDGDYTNLALDNLVWVNWKTRVNPKGYHLASGKYVVTYNRVMVGRFDTEAEAAEAYKNAMRQVTNIGDDV